LQTPKSYGYNLTGKIVLLVLFGGFMISSARAYRISGNVKGIEQCWYPRVYLEVIDDVTEHGFYSANGRNLIGEAEIDSAGNFILQGDDLPDDPMFYRLYITSRQNSRTAIQGGIHRNYMVVLLTNASEIAVTAPQICEPYFRYTVAGSNDCSALATLEQQLIRFDSVQLKNATDTRKQFVYDRCQQMLFAYADTSVFLMAAFRSIIETDIQQNYLKYRDAYERFAKKFEAAYPQSVYARQLNEMLRIEAFKQEPEKPSVSVVTIVLVVLLCTSVVLNFWLYGKTRKGQTAIVAEPNPAEDDVQKTEALIEQLTIKEREILLLVDQGLSNKEIAERLTVELSTVKTHVSRIYQKLNIKSRREVARIARHIPKSAGY